LDLKEEREQHDLSSNGRVFQKEGAAIVKDRPPKVLRLNLGLKSNNLFEDGKDLLGVSGFIRSVI